MPSKYKPKRQKLYTSLDVMNALEECKASSVSLNSIAKAYQIPETTLRRHLERTEKALPVNGGRCKNTFSDVELEEFYTYVKEINERAFGLTKV